jgi:hypothetical protein
MMSASCKDDVITHSQHAMSAHSYLSHSPHGGRELWSHFEASQLKEDATAYERRRHLRGGVRAMIGAPVQTAL